MKYRIFAVINNVDQVYYEVHFRKWFTWWPIRTYNTHKGFYTPVEFSTQEDAEKYIKRQHIKRYLVYEDDSYNETITTLGCLDIKVIKRPGPPKKL